MSNKRYRLLKDLPDAKAGDIYVCISCSDLYKNENQEKQKSPVIEYNTYFKWQIENNPTWFEEIKEQEWEIVKLKNKHPYTAHEVGEIVDYFVNCNPKNFDIYSVKRLSDNEVFSIGDFVKVKKSFEGRKGWSDPITGFIISGETMVAEFETWRQPLNDLERMHKNIHVKEEQPFQWSDELVLEYADRLHRSIERCKVPTPETITNFKKSKQQTNTIPSGERIKVTHITEPNGNQYFKFAIMGDCFSIDAEKFPSIKQAIEKILNNE